MLSSHELLKKAIEVISKVLWITWVFKPEAIVKLAENVQLFTAVWVFNTLGPLGFHVSRGLNLIYYVTTFELYGKYLMMLPWLWCEFRVWRVMREDLFHRSKSVEVHEFISIEFYFAVFHRFIHTARKCNTRSQ